VNARTVGGEAGGELCDGEFVAERADEAAEIFGPGYSECNVEKIGKVAKIFKKSVDMAKNVRYNGES